MDLAVFSEIYIYCKYLKPGQSLSVFMGQRGEMGQLKNGIFHGFSRAGQNGTVRVTVRTAGTEGSDFS